ncbi:MAG TPA: hypothetical protein VLQ80_12380 [Candidatus Saccharimonadia bacterium]|nr:hypothetical protein [Candidatus Saccharimonadia bacterium]
MPSKRTGRDVGRPKTYQSDAEKPVTVSLRLSRDVYEQAQRYVSMRHPMTLTNLLLEGLRLRLDTPADPRDMILSDDNTVRQELQAMIQAAVQAEIGKLSDFMGRQFSTSEAMPPPEAPAEPLPALSHDDNTVIQEGDKAPAALLLEVPPPERRPGRPSNRRQRILDLLQDHPTGLTEEQLMANLRARQTIGPLLAEMVSEHMLEQRGRGRTVRYRVA